MCVGKIYILYISLTRCANTAQQTRRIPSSTSPWLLAIQPGDGSNATKTHANVWPGSPVSPPAIESHSSQVQPTWSLIYQWEALLSPTFRHITILPSSRQRALSSPPEPPHTHTHTGWPLAPGKTGPHLLCAGGPFRRLLRKSRGVGKRGWGQRRLERGENI